MLFSDKLKTVFLQHLARCQFGNGNITPVVRFDPSLDTFFFYRDLKEAEADFKDHKRKEITRACITGERSLGFFWFFLSQIDEENARAKFARPKKRTRNNKKREEVK